MNTEIATTLVSIFLAWFAVTVLGRMVSSSVRNPADPACTCTTDIADVAACRVHLKERNDPYLIAAEREVEELLGNFSEREKMQREAEMKFPDQLLLED